jgi:penicillin-binding protein
MNEDAAADLQSLAALLDLTVESIQKNLSASWVKDDLFVPIRRLKKIYQRIRNMGDRGPCTGRRTLKSRGQDIKRDQRVYPLGEKAAHLVGYVQAITAEELQERKADGYTS